MLSRPQAHRDAVCRQIRQHDTPYAVKVFAKSNVDLPSLIQFFLADGPTHAATMNDQKVPFYGQVLPEQVGSTVIRKRPLGQTFRGHDQLAMVGRPHGANNIELPLCHRPPQQRLPPT